MLSVAKLYVYVVLHACECKDKARQSKNKRFQFLWQPVSDSCSGLPSSATKATRKNLHNCNENINNYGLRNMLKLSRLFQCTNKQDTTKLPHYTQSVAWLHSVHLLCTRQSVNGANRDHNTNKLNTVSYGKNKRCCLDS